MPLKLPAFAVLGLGAITLSACVENAPPPQGSIDLSPNCVAPSLQHLIGQPESALAGVTIPEPKRILKGNAPATADYVTNRTSVVITSGGVIERISCG